MRIPVSRTAAAKMLGVKPDRLRWLAEVHSVDLSTMTTDDVDMLNDAVLRDAKAAMADALDKHQASRRAVRKERHRVLSAAQKKRAKENAALTDLGRMIRDSAR